MEGSDAAARRGVCDRGVGASLSGVGVRPFEPELHDVAGCGDGVGDDGDGDRAGRERGEPTGEQLRARLVVCPTNVSKAITESVSPVLLRCLQSQRGIQLS